MEGTIVNSEMDLITRNSRAAVDIQRKTFNSPSRVHQSMMQQSNHAATVMFEN